MTLAPFYEFALRRPKLVVAIAGLMTVGMAPGVLRLTLRTDGHALVPAHAPQIRLDAEIREAFGLDDPVVIYIEGRQADDIFNFSTLRLVDDLTASLKKLQGVRPSGVFSLATESTDRVWSGTLRFRKFLEPFPETPDDLQRIRNDLRAIRLYNGTLVSKDEKATAIMVGVPAGADRLVILRRIYELVEQRRPFPERVRIIGAPVAEALLGSHILEDLGVPTSVLGFTTFGQYERPEALPVSKASQDRKPRSDAFRSLDRLRIWIARHIGLVPVALVLMTAIFLAAFRSVAAAALPLLEVGACLVFVFSLMGWLGVPVYLTTAVLPIILAATGVTDEIHIFSRYRQLLFAQSVEDSVDLVRKTMSEVARPCVMTSLTTCIGFLAFGMSEIAPVRAFGIFTAVGGLFCMFWSLSVVPALLVILPPRYFATKAQLDSSSPAALWLFFRTMGRWVIRIRLLPLLAMLVAILVAVQGTRKITVQDSWIDGFAESSEFYQAISDFNEAFLGMHVLLVCVDAGGDVIQGELPAAAMDVYELRLPSGSVVDPQKITGWRMRMKRKVIPGITPPEDDRRRMVDEWQWWIESALRDGDDVRVILKRGQPIPAGLFQLGPDEVVEYQIFRAPLLQSGPLFRIAQLERMLESQADLAVGGVLGTADYVETVNYMISGRKEGERRIPKDVARIARIWSEYERIRGEERRRQLVDAHYSRSIITVLMKNANFIDTAQLLANIRKFEEDQLRRRGFRLSFAGDVAVSQTLIDAIIRTELRSLLAALGGVLVVTALLGRSLVFGLLCVIPSSLAVLLNFGFMGWMGIPLGVATSMFSAMTLGIGVDYAIHLQSRYRRLLNARRASEGGNPSHDRKGAQRDDAEAQRHESMDKPQLSPTDNLQSPIDDLQPVSTHEALSQAIATTGTAILVDTLAVALGFGALILSQVPANARLGALLALSIVNCFLATILILPALLAFGRVGNRASA